MFDGADPVTQALFIAPVDLARWADRVRPYLAKMADTTSGRYETSDIFAALAAGRMQMWIAIDGVDLLCVMLTELQTYPRCRAMRIIALVGHRPNKWRGLLPLVEREAKHRFGCTMMEVAHLPRFRSVLPGYRTTHWFGEKVID